MDETIKTLKDVTDEEMLSQIGKIYKEVFSWLDVTGITEIRKKLPKLETVPDNIEPEEAEKIREKNKKKFVKQAKDNIAEIFNSARSEHPHETARVIRLCCFIDPEDNSKSIIKYIPAFFGMFEDETVLNFFTFCQNMAQMFGLKI